MKAFRFDHARVQRIHADPARPEFFRERTGDGIDRCFRGGVDGPAGLRAHGSDGTDVDDASAVRAEGFGCFLRDEEKALLCPNTSNFLPLLLPAFYFSVNVT